ncbi:MAG: sensor domain-containing diguanylate cyclase [Gammaproteobacteria bacterium]|nr:sensor domain-containing diguanylate cyclase [Gammaproteobacteria bacterium]
MIKPPAIHGETLRLQSLHSMKILDTHPEDRFDRITRLAARVFNTPIALVSLVDKDRQWFKSKHGLDACETVREISFCGHAIAQDEVMVVEDAQRDKRFCDNPLVTGEPHIRFYAGYPLRTSTGLKLGTFCIIDSEPREFSAEDAETLLEMGQMVEEELHAMAQATTDELTFISNRRGFTAIATHVLAICRRIARPVTLLMFDLDDFKRINDQFGHQAGDKALVYFATLLLKTFRDAEVVARLGGDEFCVLCTNLQARDMSIALERLQAQVDDWNASVDQHGTLRFSVGTTMLNEQRDATVDDLIHEADQGMYTDKHSRKEEAV